MPISAKTVLLGLMGWPVGHSLSPAIHNAAAAALELDVVYVALPVAPGQVETALRGLVALGFLGANVTVPHKQAVMPFLDTVDPAAKAIGAVNTIRVERSVRSISNPQSPVSTPHSPPSLSGFNTDSSGFLADLEQHKVDVAGRDCLVLGAGGSARAVVYALAQTSGRVTVYARRPVQAQQLVADLRPHLPGALIQTASWQQLSAATAFNAPLVVNTTPVGMHPHEDASPWPEGLPFPRGGDLYDLIYNPQDTRLMQQARAAGCRAFNGLGMLLQQGAQAFEIWTGVRPPLEVMAAGLRRALTAG